MDGVGKTTNAYELYKKLKKRGISCYYLHPHNYTISKTSFVNKNIVNKLHFFLKLGIPIAITDHLITYLTKFKIIKKHRLLICDRYFYDKLVKFLFFDICNKKIAHLYLRLIPKPDITFLLDAPIDIVYKRKREYSIEEYKKLRKIYLELSEEISPPPIVVNTTDNIKLTSEMIYEHIINFVSK